MLSNVSKYVKVGGYLYYSTCSIMDKENDGVITTFLANNPNYKVQKIDSLLVYQKTNHGIQFLPDISGGNGFYIAKLKREN